MVLGRRSHFSFGV